MTTRILQTLALATTGCALLFPAPGFAQAPGKPMFAAPKRIKAGDEFLGEGRLYPSPVLHDVDGDQRPDIVIGDLFGKVTFAPRATGREIPAYGTEKVLEDRFSKPLKFHNW